MKTPPLRTLQTILVLIIFMLGVTACGKSFSSLLEEAQTDYTNTNYIDVIDHLNLALRKWRKSNGLLKKGEAYQLLGMAYQKIHKPENAKGAYLQAIKYSNNVYGAVYELGVFYMDTNDYGRAKTFFSNALQMKPNDPLSLLGLGDCYYMTGHYEEAKETYNRLLDTSTGVRLAIKNLGLVNAKLKSKAKKRRFR